MADRPSFRKNSLESEAKSRQDFVESNRVDPSEWQTNDWRYQQRRPSFWERIPEGAIEGAKLVAFSLVGIGLTVMVLQELSPSPKKQQVAQAPLQSKPMPPLVPQDLPTSAVPKQLSPSPELTPLPQFSPLPAVPLPDSLTPSSSPTNKEQPLLPSASPVKIPRPNQTNQPKLNTQPSSPGSGLVIPPSLPSDIPIKPPSPAQATNLQGTPTAADKKANSDKSSTAVEVKNYFNKHWQPPSGLTQTLEYSLVLNKDGSLERISPLSNAAARYIDQANMPLPDSQLISPRKEEGKTNVHLVLSPDGKVKAELE
ncbi:MAG TPA: hypothetical protein V6D11_30765 [Waterburya sp.]|jgi:hypothetical protein